MLPKPLAFRDIGHIKFQIFLIAFLGIFVSKLTFYAFCLYHFSIICGLLSLLCCTSATQVAGVSFHSSCAYSVWTFLTEEIITKFTHPFNPIRFGGGAQMPGWPNSHLPFRNFLVYDTQTLLLSVFIFKTCSDQILAKLINLGGCCCSFLIKRSQKFTKWKNFPLLGNC